MRGLSFTAAALGSVLSCASLSAQSPPDLSGVWRLEPERSRLVGGGGAPSEEHQVTWLIDHRDPEIAVIVNVRDAGESHEFSFACTTDGRECVNELPLLDQVRRMSSMWEGNVLVTSQRVSSPLGDFITLDRVSLSASGDELVMARVVTNEAGERRVRQVFRKLGPHPSRRLPPERLPSVDLPPELDRVLRDYESFWRAGDAEALVTLFTEDGFVVRHGGWIRGTDRLRDSLEGTSSDLLLRAVAFDHDDRVGYIIGAYGYGEDAATVDTGLFVLTLRRAADGRWLITADLDRGSGQ